jgi:hypothetical protein
MRKYILFLIFFSIHFATTSYCIAQSNPVPNPSFEQWFYADRPVGWSPVVEGLPISPISKSTDAHSGSFAVEGVPEIQNGITTAPPQLTSTFPINFRPTTFEGWYKFTTIDAIVDGDTIVDGDVLRFQVQLFSKAKMIGIASWADSLPMSEYEQFISTIIYSDTAIPDSATILFQTTNYRGFAGGNSSEFLVDDLALTNDTITSQIQSIEVAGTPNLTPGDSTTISWTLSGILPDSINIDVSYDGSLTWTPIQHGLDTSVHSYNWIIPNVTVTGAVIRISSGGEVGYSSPFNIVESSVAETNVMSGYSITPNPSSTSVNLSFDLASVANVNLDIYDPLGRVVYQSDPGILSAGQHEIQLDASKLTSGIYLCRLSAGGVELETKFVVER